MIDDKILHESYLDVENQFTQGQLELTLGVNEYFLMGDNRKVSNDSRGSINSQTDVADNPWTITDKDIIGRAFLRWWPLNKLSFISIPTYNINSKL